VKQLIKRLLYRGAPRFTTAMMSARARAHSHRVVAEWGGAAVAVKLLERFGTRVREGPFAGLALTPMSHAEQIGPYLLGVYESELDTAWAIVFRGKYRQVVDVGAKFGYYAVGLARRYPDVPVVAFDTDSWARRAIAEMAAANGTPNVVVKKFCTPAWLSEHAADTALILSDCEGYEDVLFEPRTVARLRSTTLIVETHDELTPGVTDRLCATFGSTHEVRRYDRQPRRLASGNLEFLTAAERQFAEHEMRGPQAWLLCLPTTGPNASLRHTTVPVDEDV
jgi:hypothetical protein